MAVVKEVFLEDRGKMYINLHSVDNVLVDETIWKGE